MSLLFRAAIYTIVMFLVMIVYMGQKETTAAGTLLVAARKTVRFVLYTIVAVIVMLGIEYLFVD